MTTEEILAMPDNQVINLVSKVGKLGSTVKLQIMKDVCRFTDRIQYVVITRGGFLKYWGNGLIAAYEGIEGIDKKSFKSPDEAAKFIESELSV